MTAPIWVLEFCVYVAQGKSYRNWMQRLSLKPEKVFCCLCFVCVKKKNWSWYGIAGEVAAWGVSIPYGCCLNLAVPLLTHLPSKARAKDLGPLNPFQGKSGWSSWLWLWSVLLWLVAAFLGMNQHIENSLSKPTFQIKKSIFIKIKSRWAIWLEILFPFGYSDFSNVLYAKLSQGEVYTWNGKCGRMKKTLRDGVVSEQTLIFDSCF